MESAPKNDPENKLRWEDVYEKVLTGCEGIFNSRYFDKKKTDAFVPEGIDDLRGSDLPILVTLSREMAPLVARAYFYDFIRTALDKVITLVAENDAAAFWGLPREDREMIVNAKLSTQDESALYKNAYGYLLGRLMLDRGTFPVPTDLAMTVERLIEEHHQRELPRLKRIPESLRKIDRSYRRHYLQNLEDYPTDFDSDRLE